MSAQVHANAPLFGLQLVISIAISSSLADAVATFAGHNCQSYYYCPFNCPFSRTTLYQEGKTSLYLNDARDDGGFGIQWHQLDHMQTICTSLQSDNHTSTSSLNFYRPRALPDAQATVSKHSRIT